MVQFEFEDTIHISKARESMNRLRTVTVTRMKRIKQCLHIIYHQSFDTFDGLANNTNESLDQTGQRGEIDEEIDGIYRKE
jgi:hypothetical protein